MTDQAIRNLNLTLHLMKKNIFFSFLLKIHDRVMSLCLPQDYLPKMTTPWENSRICVPSNLSWGGGELFILLKIQTRIGSIETS